MNPEPLKNKLARLHDHVAGPPQPEPKRVAPERSFRFAEHLNGQLVEQRSGNFCLTTTLYPWGYQLGQTRLVSKLAETNIALGAFGADDDPRLIDPSDLVFFDTETTGLGGAGVVPFLVGCGSYTEAGFEVRQYTIPDYSDEAAMMESLLEEFGEAGGLVSYNGRAFDLPIVRDRMIINNVAREVPHEHHLDLLHSTRRLFSRRLADCSLTNVERELFGFHRQDDIPGYLIPSVYFEWLQTDRMDHLPAVLEHNRYDILSMALLVSLLSEAFVSGGETLSEADDLHSLARVYGRRRQTGEVVRLFGKIQDGGGDLTADALLFHAQSFKRAGRWNQAVELWQRLTGGGGREAYWAHLELAKYREHRTKEFESALEHTRLAGQCCPYGENHRLQLRHRRKRLEGKLASD